MPGKGRRVASRQAEVGRRRRRQNRSTVAVSDGSPVRAAENRPNATVTTPEKEPSSPSTRMNSSSQASPTPQRSSTRTRMDRPAAYNYVVPELRRILIMSGVLLAVLITSSFFI